MGLAKRWPLADVGLAPSVSRGAVDAIFGFPSYALIVFLLILTAVFNYGLIKATGFNPTDGTHPIAPLIENKSLAFRALLFYVAVVQAPIVEEIMFRGVLYSALRSRYGAAISIFASGFLFAAIHPQGLLGLAPLTAVGCVLAAIREWRDSLYGCMIAHACVNGFTLLYLLALT